MWCVILYNHYLYSIFYHCHLSVSFTRVSCHLLLSDSVRCLYCKASMIVGDITINHPLFIIHSSSINHPFIIHSSSIHHSLIIQSSSIHHPSIIHSSSIHHPFIIHSQSISHPFIIRPSSIHHPFIIHSSSIPLVIHSSSVHHPFIIHSSSIHNPLVIHSSSVHHPFIMHSSSINHPLNHYHRFKTWNPKIDSSSRWRRRRFEALPGVCMALLPWGSFRPL